VSRTFCGSEQRRNRCCLFSTKNFWQIIKAKTESDLSREKENYFPKNELEAISGFCFRNTEQQDFIWETGGKKEKFREGESFGKPRRVCGKAELFHTVHRFIHRTFFVKKQGCSQGKFT